jgi:predicted transcriptional regulator
VSITLDLPPETAARLRRAAEASGESVEALAARAVEDLAAELGEAIEGNWGDDAELERRIAAWRANPTGVPAEEVHAWLQSLGTDHPLPEPQPRPYK